MNTLVIPFAGAPAGVADKKVVVDMEDIVTLEQKDATSTIIYVSNSSSGKITLTHGSAADGSVGNAINKAILNSNQGNSVVVMPTGVAVSAVSYT